MNVFDKGINIFCFMEHRYDNGEFHGRSAFRLFSFKMTRFFPPRRILMGRTLTPCSVQGSAQNDKE
jgi:hypothetical protein